MWKASSDKAAVIIRNDKIISVTYGIAGEGIDAPDFPDISIYGIIMILIHI